MLTKKKQCERIEAQSTKQLEAQLPYTEHETRRDQLKNTNGDMREEEDGGEEAMRTERETVIIQVELRVEQTM